MQGRATKDWIDTLEALSVGCGPINKLSEVFADPQIIARKAVLEMRHASGADVKIIANPVRLSETPADYRLPPPTLGQHTEEVLLGLLGIAPEKFAALRAAGVI